MNRCKICAHQIAHVRTVCLFFFGLLANTGRDLIANYLTVPHANQGQTFFHEIGHFGVFCHGLQTCRGRGRPKTHCFECGHTTNQFDQLFFWVQDMPGNNFVPCRDLALCGSRPNPAFSQRLFCGNTNFIVGVAHTVSHPLPPARVLPWLQNVAAEAEWAVQQTSSNRSFL